MIHVRSWPLAALLVLTIGGALVAQDNGTVRVTSARANIRSEPSETSQVLTQVTAGTVLYLIAVEGDWFHVRVPMGSLRVDAYISKKVSKIDTPPPASATAPAAHPGGASAPPPPPPPETSRDGMSVTITTSAGNSTLLVPAGAHVVTIADKPDSLARIAASLPASAAPPAVGGSPSSQVTYVWVADGASSPTSIDDHRPGFVVLFKDVPGLSPDDLTAMLVRLTPAPSGVRVIAAVRGRADEASRDEADWDVLKDLKEDVIRAQVQVVDRGGVKVTPAADLPPGEYAVVVRPVARKKLAGTDVLGTSGEGRVLSALWDFSIK